MLETRPADKVQDQQLVTYVAVYWILLRKTLVARGHSCSSTFKRFSLFCGQDYFLVP